MHYPRERGESRIERSSACLLPTARSSPGGLSDAQTMQGWPNGARSYPGRYSEAEKARIKRWPGTEPRAWNRALGEVSRQARSLTASGLRWKARGLPQPPWTAAACLPQRCCQNCASLGMWMGEAEALALCRPLCARAAWGTACPASFTGADYLGPRPREMEKAAYSKRSYCPRS